MAIGHFGWFRGVLGVYELLAMSNGALFAAPIPESRTYRSVGGNHPESRRGRYARGGGGREGSNTLNPERDWQTLRWKISSKQYATLFMSHHSLHLPRFPDVTLIENASSIDTPAIHASVGRAYLQFPGGQTAAPWRSSRPS